MGVAHVARLEDAGTRYFNHVMMDLLKVLYSLDFLIYTGIRDNSAKESELSP